MLKKTTLAILSLAMSGLAFAGDMGAPSCIPGDVTIPCEGRAWDLGAQALYLQPIYTADKGYERSLALGYKSVDPKWGWGYRIEGSYHFRTANDIIMTLMHYDIDTNHGDYLGPTILAPIPFPFRLHLENKFDQVNLVLGQRADLSVWDRVRFYGGLQYAKIRVDERNNYLLPRPLLLGLGILGLQQFRNADVNGVGPTVGIDYSYDLFSGFGLTANTATSILYGSTRFTEGYVFLPTGLVSFGSFSSQKVVVPSFEAKLGLRYLHACSQGILNLNAGFQALNYFQALESRGQAAGFASTLHSTDFALYGPYFGAKWVGDV